MGLFSDDSAEAQAHSQVQTGHKSHLSHELIAAAASYAAAKAYEKHCAANGKPANHAEATAFIASAVGGFVDHIAETKGLDFIDKEKAKHDGTPFVS
ncbi:hypothetical protein JAAARDRAFT_137378 [Jaapia argillacea MUCL 33604]|uniref:Uncharacterized protein n=1 Tax=Jaapia argillacea MUCL 33604 TaxID=933084 RepID=A0A067PEX2_9AGAM|nr:hypothetical protein JAAARDRAFT_137378 [Jaapia argillacea MUCL 33604]